MKLQKLCTNHVSNRREGFTLLELSGQEHRAVHRLREQPSPDRPSLECLFPRQPPIRLEKGSQQLPSAAPHAILKTKDWFHPDGFPIAVERRDPQEPFGPHAHEFAEIVIITAGRGEHLTGKESYPLNAGDAFVIGGSCRHDYRGMERLCLVNILFQPEKLGLRTYDLHTLPGYDALFTLEPAWPRRHQFNGPLRLTPAELRTLMAFVDNLDAELYARASGFKFMATAIFMQIVGYLSRCYAKAKHPDPRALLRIGAAINHLEVNYQEPINLDVLTQITHMSKRNFIRSFQAAMRISPIAYLVQLRVTRGASLLRRTELSVTEVAFEVGFSDSNYFARQFHKVLGVTPSQYRQQQAKLTRY